MSVKHNDYLTLAILIAILFFVLTLMTKSSFGKALEPTYVTKAERLMVVDESMLLDYLINLSAVDIKALTKMVLAGQAVVLPAGTKVIIRKVKIPLDKDGGGLYEVKVGKQKGWMLVTPGQLKEARGMRV